MAFAEFVYVISGDHGRQKIGVSNHPKARLKELQTGSPFPLAFEFVGLADEGAAYAIEAEAHFMLNDHRQSGEWFTVPPEMAIAAVMGAARRIGRTLKPVDPDQISRLNQNPARQPWWLIITMLPFYGWFAYYVITVGVPQVQDGSSFFGVLIFLVVMLGVLRLVQWLVRFVGERLIALWRSWQDLMNPEGGEKMPLDS